jgi:hypothetical protein
MEATNQLSETKLISLDITEAKSLLMRLLCVNAPYDLLLSADPVPASQWSRELRLYCRANHWLSVGKLTLFETQKQTGL